MTKHKTPEWNLLIDAFLAGDEMPFLNTFKLLVTRHRHFRVKDEFTIWQQYRIDPEDFFSERVLEILALDLLRRWKRYNLPDSALNHQIRGFVLNRIRDLVKKNRVTYEEADAMDLAGVVAAEETETEELVRLIMDRLDSQERFIFQNYHKFLQGDANVLMLVRQMGLSKATIEKKIRKIKKIIKEELTKPSH